MIAGCSSQDERLARFAEQAVERQAEQNRRMADLQQQVAEGSRRLVEADAQSRAELTNAHRALQAERVEIGRQRDALEEDRQEIASKRITDPLIAAALMNAGILVACILPLVLCWYLLRHSETDVPGDAVMAEVLLNDLVAGAPVLLARHEPRRLTVYPTGDGGADASPPVSPE